MTYYAVIKIDTLEVLHVGTNSHAAAVVLRQGTCHGRGATERAAIEEARHWAMWFRARRAA